MNMVELGDKQWRAFYEKLGVTMGSTSGKHVSEKEGGLIWEGQKAVVIIGLW